MIKKLMIVGVSTLLLIGCSGKNEQILNKKSIDVTSSRSKYFNVTFNNEKIRIPILKDYQQITKESDSEMFDVLNILEQSPASTNIAFLLSNADYMGLISGIREHIEDSYFVIRTINQLKNKNISKQDFEIFKYLQVKNYKRIMKSNYANDVLNKNIKKINSDTKLKYHEDMGLQGVSTEPLAIQENDDRSFIMTNLLTFKIDKKYKKVLNIGGFLYYNHSLITIVENSSVKDKLTDNFIKEKEDVLKEYMKSFK